MSVININLLPSAQKQPLLVFDRGLAIGIGILAVEVIAILLFVAVMNQRISALNDQIAAQEQQLVQVQEQVKEVDDLRDQVTQLEAKADLLERIKQSPIQLAEILSDLADNTPTGVWFSNINVNQPVGGAGSVALEGKTSTYREVADLMLNLDSSPMFGNATLTTTRIAQAGVTTAGGNVTFTMTGDLSPAVIGGQQ
jgi:type IV pilus assembly protein PilN